MQKIRHYVFVCLFLILLHYPAIAYRPFSTEDAGVAGAKIFQLELSHDYIQWSRDQKDSGFLLVPVFGVSDEAELSLEIPFVSVQPAAGQHEEGIGDINFALKYLLRDTGKSQISLKSFVKWNNGDYTRGLGTGDKDYHVSVAFSENLKFGILHAQAGITFVGKKNNPDLQDIKMYGLALDVPLAEKVNGVLEFAGNEHPDKTSPVSHFSTFLFGATYTFSPKAVFDVGVRYGLTRVSPDFSVTTGTSFGF